MFTHTVHYTWSTNGHTKHTGSVTIRTPTTTPPTETRSKRAAINDVLRTVAHTGQAYTWVRVNPLVPA